MTDNINYPHIVEYLNNTLPESEGIIKELEEYAKSLKKPILEYQSPETYVDAYNEFYDNLK